MTSQWRVLDFTGFDGTLTSSRGHLTARYRDGREKTAALADTAVVLVGVRCSIRPGVLAVAGNYGVPIVVCDWRGIPVAGSWSWSEHSTVGGRQRGQLNQSLPSKKSAWKVVVGAKIRGQAEVLSQVGDPGGGAALREMASTVRSGDPGNVESLAARTYWPRLFRGLDFSRDRLAQDEANGMLNYAYTVIRGVVLKEVVASGLWPAAGIHHSNMRNGFPLVDDLIEPFRPAADYLVWNLVEAGRSMADPETKRELVGVLDATYDPATGHTVRTEITSLARAYGMYVEDGKPLQVRNWRLR